ncbi:large conductance mechanosensitive channel protein MscL [Rhodococcus sp. (in: high G+C Gram-positive bacteria)]|uniref:large conductance mechanosensitive channel protein MscL n=1 Tax=Rhodococcus sp. TaxID=1831 RepID=UPI00388E3C1F
MLKGFKDFLLRGNVIELAVAVVVGAAFTAIVTAFTSNIINPLIAAVGGDNEMGFGFRVIASNDATFIDVGAVIAAGINFFIIAAVVYFVLILPVNLAKARFAPDKEPADEPLSETDLLIQIRDLLETGTYRQGGDDSLDQDGSLEQDGNTSPRGATRVNAG